MAVGLRTVAQSGAGRAEPSDNHRIGLTFSEPIASARDDSPSGSVRGATDLLDGRGRLAPEHVRGVPGQKSAPNGQDAVPDAVGGIERDRTGVGHDAADGFRGQVDRAACPVQDRQFAPPSGTDPDGGQAWFVGQGLDAPGERRRVGQGRVRPQDLAESSGSAIPRCRGFA